MPVRQFVTCRIDTLRLGLDILAIREVNALLDITPVQHAPAYVRGFINLRGQIVTVFDLAVRLGLEPRGITPESHNIILKSEPVGLLVDGMDEIVQVGQELLEPAPGNTRGLEREFIEGVVQLPEELLIVLSVARILSHELSKAPDAS